MPYRQSAPLRRWLDQRARTIDVLAEGHARVGDPSAPSHVRVELEPVGPEDDESAVLLLDPELVTPAA